MLGKLSTSFEQTASLNDGLRPLKEDTRPGSVKTPVGADQVEADFSQLKTDLSSLKDEIAQLRTEIDQQVGTDFRISLTGYPIIKAAYKRVFGISSEWLTYTDYRSLLLSRTAYEQQKARGYMEQPDV